MTALTRAKEHPMAKAKSQIKRVSRRRPVNDLAAASLTVGSPEIGVPQLGQIHRIRRRVHHLTAASLPGSAPEFVFVEDHVAPPPPVITRRRTRRDDAKVVIGDLFPNSPPPDIGPNDLYNMVAKELAKCGKNTLDQNRASGRRSLQIKIRQIGILAFGHLPILPTCRDDNQFLSRAFSRYSRCFVRVKRGAKCPTLMLL